MAARPINVTFNGSNTTSCASFRRTDWVQARLHDGEQILALNNVFKWATRFVPCNDACEWWATATLPLLATENIYTVVIDDTDVGTWSIPFDFQFYFQFSSVLDEGQGMEGSYDWLIYNWVKPITIMLYCDFVNEMW